MLSQSNQSVLETLDITFEKETGRDLIKRVNNMVKETQSIIIRPYPSLLLMTKSQFNDLMATSGIVDMYGSEEDQMFITSDKIVLEVRVKDE